MKPQRRKLLVLDRETVRRLDAPQLGAAHGAMPEVAPPDGDGGGGGGDDVAASRIAASIQWSLKTRNLSTPVAG